MKLLSAFGGSRQVGKDLSKTFIWIAAALVFFVSMGEAMAKLVWGE
jgi:hypothetical protein